MEAQYPARQESSDRWSEIELSVDAEGSDSRMCAGQLSQSHGDGVGNEGGDDVAEDDAGSGNLEGRGRAQEKSGADQAADRNHGHLAGGELMMETFFVNLLLRSSSWSDEAGGMGNDNKSLGVLPAVGSCQVWVLGSRRISDLRRFCD